MSESEVPERWSFEYARMKRHADTRPSFEIGAKILEELGAAEAKLALLPADWQQDSSLQTWFPFTAEELDGVKAKVREQAATIERYQQAVELAFHQKIHTFQTDEVSDCCRCGYYKDYPVHTLAALGKQETKI